MKTMSSELHKEQEFLEELDTKSGNEHSLILYNDDYHSFEYVIESLIEVCGHSIEQAEQCTMITHYKGKCDVKQGSYNKLKPLKEGLIDRELRAAIE